MELIKSYGYILVGMVLLPSLVTAATDCQIIEYPDRIDAVCVGDEKNDPVQTQTSRVPEPVQPRQAAKASAGSKAVTTEETPIAVQPSMAVAARLAVKARGEQPSVALPGKEPVAGQTDSVKSPVTTGQPQNDMAAARVASDSKAKGKGKISFIARMKNNLAVSSMAKH